MPKVSNKAWSKYKRIVQNFLDQDSGRQEIVWAKHINQILRIANLLVFVFFSRLFYNVACCGGKEENVDCHHTLL